MGAFLRSSKVIHSLWSPRTHLRVIIVEACGRLSDLIKGIYMEVEVHLGFSKGSSLETFDRGQLLSHSWEITEN